MKKKGGVGKGGREIKLRRSRKEVSRKRRM